jgi:hypothetical protein
MKKADLIGNFTITSTALHEKRAPVVRQELSFKS